MRFREKILGLLDEYGESSPIGKISIISQIRTYFRTVTIDEGFDLIDALTSKRDFNILIGAGMKGVFYYRLIRRKAELLGI